MSEQVVGLVAVACLFGGPVVYFVVNSIATNWRKARVAEQNAVLKRDMIEKGFTADEIVRVIAAGTGDGRKMADKSPEPAKA